MEIKFISEYGELDLTNAKVSVQENNSKVSDTMFTKYMLPFETYATQDFLRKYGDYVSYETTNLQNKIPGYLQFENKVHDGFLYIQSIEGYKITAQIDFGFEELPNFDKMLSELPLEKYDVPDIYSFATAICKKKWPETNFNFPRIYTEKYSPDSDPWTTFDGYYNDLKKDGSEMRRNYIDEAGQIFNVNIIHPCPHPIYLLMTGFLDAGFELAGDILADSNLQQKWLFSGTEYFSRLSQRRIGKIINVMDYVETWKIMPYYYPVGEYYDQIIIPKSGKYKLQAYIKLGTHYSGLKKSELRLSFNGNQIYYTSSGDNVDRTIDMEITITQENSVIDIWGIRSYGIGDTELFIKLDLFSKELYEDNDGEDNGVITNPNAIDLTRSVPEMTFGEYVNVIKNWFNYDIEIIGKIVVMNQIGKNDVANVKNLKFLEIPDPKRTFLNKKSFLLRFTELQEKYKKNNMFYDSSGPILNGIEKSETNIIEINGYAMPLTLPKQGGYNTAFVAKDSTDVVALVEYSGLQAGQNNATYSPGCDFPELFTNNWLKWLRQRINGQEFNWKSYCNIEEICNYSVKDYIFCYNNIHIIKYINKEKISENIYEIDITTETVV